MKSLRMASKIVVEVFYTTEVMKNLTMARMRIVEFFYITEVKFGTRGW